MTENEKNELKLNYMVLLEILDFYAKNKGRLGMNEKEHTDYVNDILDEIVDIRKKLEIDRF